MYILHIADFFKSIAYKKLFIKYLLTYIYTCIHMHFQTKLYINKHKIGTRLYLPVKYFCTWMLFKQYE